VNDRDGRMSKHMCEGVEYQRDSSRASISSFGEEIVDTLLEMLLAP
jgi:hypothetical protein